MAPFKFKASPKEYNFYNRKSLQFSKMPLIFSSFPPASGYEYHMDHVTPTCIS